MSENRAIIKSADDYFKKLTEFTTKQQEQVKAMITENQKSIIDSKPFVEAKEIDSQIEELMKHVNDELDAAMEKVNQQMALSTQKPADAGPKSN